MQIRLIPFMFGVSLLTLLAAHTSALLFSLYWIYPWLDIPMHVLGGMTVALGFFYFSFIRERLPTSFQGMGGVLLSVLLVGVLWEMYEQYIDAHIDLAMPFGTIDTLSDLCADVVGGTVGYYVGVAFSKLEK